MRMGYRLAWEIKPIFFRIAEIWKELPLCRKRKSGFAAARETSGDFNQVWEVGLLFS
jgi:hypothetical protein